MSSVGYEIFIQYGYKECINIKFVVKLYRFSLEILGTIVLTTKPVFQYNKSPYFLLNTQELLIQLELYLQENEQAYYWIAFL